MQFISLRPPGRWQQAVRRLPLGGDKDQKYTAWLGDKRLGAAAANALNETQTQHTRGSASKLTGVALSNAFMAANVDTILPDHDITHMSVNSIGTEIEAAVAEIYEVDETAVADLARWLIEKAEASPDPNAKGELLNLGGVVEAFRVGGADHVTTFRATAELGGHITEGEGTSKKIAEQLAAGTLLLDLRGREKSFIVPKSEASPDPNAKGELLNLGGVVEATRVGGFDHLPTFRATAELDGHITEGDGTSKKIAEQLAAGTLLLDLREKRYE